MVVDDLYFDVDEWSLQDIVRELKKLGYKGYARLWYKELEMNLNSGIGEMKSDANVMRIARLLVSGSVKHCEVYVVDGVKEGKWIEITSNDVDYMPEEGEDSGNGLLKVEVDAELEPSTKEEAFDDSADDGDHEDHFGFEVEDNDPQSNAFGAFNGPLNKEVLATGVAQGDRGLGEVDEKIGDIYDGYETEEIDSYKGDSDDMIKKKRFLRYNEAEMSREYEFRVGLEFKSLNHFKDVIKEHALLNSRDIRLASSNWISKKIANNISRGEEMKLATVIQTIQDKYMANISVGKAYWARRKPKIQCDTIIPAVFRVKPGIPKMARIREPDENNNCGQYEHNRRHCLNPIVTDNAFASGTETTAENGVETIADVQAGNAAIAQGSVAIATGSRVVRGRGRGRVVGMDRKRDKERSTSASHLASTTASPSQLPSITVPPSQSALSTAPPSQPPNTIVLPSQSPNTTAPPSQPASITALPFQPSNTTTTLSHLASIPTTLSQPAIPATPTKVFGVKRSERLKLGVRKAKTQPLAHVDLTLD
ncbi:hypothetical protein Ahy_B06g081445 [Arachis hypogaea]|uniref:PB1-like domain-containing protein n=1 Tax=Arachis hypogaea TaxID=3818 RepID=A0A444YL62_ARAHY|nr:hypothetical protein Ahy_B06g081445 [Arachis hypogaea]